MRQPSVAEMNAFVAVAEQKSFAKAALQLGVSRSGLSETIGALEARLGEGSAFTTEPLPLPLDERLIQGVSRAAGPLLLIAAVVGIAFLVL